MVCFKYIFENIVWLPIYFIIRRNIFKVIFVKYTYLPLKHTNCSHFPILNKMYVITVARPKVYTTATKFRFINCQIHLLTSSRKYLRRTHEMAYSLLSNAILTLCVFYVDYVECQTINWNSIMFKITALIITYTYHTSHKLP